MNVLLLVLPLAGLHLEPSGAHQAEVSFRTCALAAREVSRCTWHRSEWYTWAATHAQHPLHPNSSSAVWTQSAWTLGKACR
eukprot:387712-Pelagomonas_calceolata.AAC.2